MEEIKEIKLSVAVFITKENDTYVTYCPALELSSYGDSIEDAKESFEDALRIFVEETQKKGTFEKMLLHLGWALRQRPVVIYDPPPLESIPGAFGKVIKSEVKSYYETGFSIPA
jgi:predicted RNase H-like HicB family nuclease